MPIEQLESGAIICTGNSVKLYQLLALRGALKLEIIGMRRRGRQASAIVRDLLGVKTRDKAALLTLLEAHIEEVGPELGRT